MKKNPIIYFRTIYGIACAFTYILAFISPAGATDSFVNINAGTTVSASEPMINNAGVTKASNLEPAKTMTKVSLPKKIFSIATAFLVGTPVCVVRRSKYEQWYGVHGMIGDSESKCKKILAGTFWF